MLRQADTMLAGQKPKPEVYNAMAASLGQAWRALNDQLEIRRTILERNVAFHRSLCTFKFPCLIRRNQSK